MTAGNAGGAALFGERLGLVERYVDLLAGRGIEWGLVGPREVDRLWDRHVLNCVAPAALIATGSSVVDVGSGAGLPGIPLAILRPDLRVTLLEPLLRRATFLTDAVEELGLTGRVRVVRARAEDHRERYDVATARAVAPLDRLVGWCVPLLLPGGVLLALKGRTACDEVARTRGELRRAGLEADVLTLRPAPDAEEATVVRVRSLGKDTREQGRTGGT